MLVRDAIGPPAGEAVNALDPSRIQASINLAWRWEAMMKETQDHPEDTPVPAEEPQTTMTDAGEKNPGEDPDFDEATESGDDREPEVLPDDPDIQGDDGSVQPG